MMIMGNLPFKSDLIRELTKLAIDRGLQAGVVQLFGSLGSARLSYFDQIKRAYQIRGFDAPFEIVSGTGNISLKNELPFVHLHLAIADHDGKVFGGHALDGCRIYAVEYAIWPFNGPAPKRVHDHVTGLYLWERERYEPAAGTT